MALDLFLGGRNNPLDGSNNNNPVIGSQVERFIELRNLGPGAETNVVISSPLPSNVTARTWEITTDDTPGAVAVPDGPQVGPINVTVSSLGDGDSIIIEFTDTYGAVGSDSITASVTSTQTPVAETFTLSPPGDGDSFDLDCNPALDVTDSTAELRATVDGTAQGVRGLGFRWGTTPGGPYPNVAPAGFNAVGSWTIAGNGIPNQQYGITIDGLVPTTTYYYVPTTSTGVGLQDPSPAPAECSFTTAADDQADASCAGVTDLEWDSATLNGQATQAVAGPGDYFFRWGEDVPGPVELPNQTPPTPVPAGTLVLVTAPLTGLSELTAYRFRLFVRDSTGTVRAVSEVCTFTTNERLFDSIDCAPADNITDSGGRMLGSGDNVDPSASVRFRWGTTPGGPYPNTSFAVPGNGTVDQQFNTTTTGETPNTDIYYILEVLDSANVISGTSDECSFTTLNDGPEITGLDNQTGPVNVEQSDTFQVDDSGPAPLTVTAAPPGATLVDNGGGSWTITYTPVAAGPTTFTITATDDAGASSSADITFNATASTEPGPPVLIPAPCADDEAQPANDVEGAILCDVLNGQTVGTALVEAVYDEETGERTGTRTVSVDDGTQYVAQGTLQPCTDPPIGWESVCYTTTATGEEVLPGTKRHDDRFPAPGFLVFNSDGQRVDDQPGYEQVNCDQCCPVPFGEGCWANVNGDGTWVTLRESDGTIIGPLDTLTGDPIDPADIGDCPAQQITTQLVNVRTHMRNLNAGQTWTPADLVGETALSLSFTVLTGTADVVDSDATPVNALPVGFTAEWSANEDTNTLFPPQSIAAVGGRTIAAWTSRA